MQMKITLIGWYNYDSSIFDNVSVPDGLDRETMLKSILMRCGEFNIIYSNPEFLKFAIKNWSERHKAQFEKMAAALAETYDPLHNYDRHETFTDNRKSTGSANSGNTTENTVSADNASTYQPDNKSIGSMTNTTSGNEDITHNAHLYGKIGVTTSQQMLESEIDLRYMFGVYDLIAAKFAEEFCIAIY